MTLAGLVVFILAYATAAASPGPGVAATVARTLGHGMKGALGWVAGFVVGDLIWFWAAALGLAVIAKAHSGVLDVIRYCGAAYLLYLAYRLWTSKPDPIDMTAQASDEPFWRPFLASLALTIGNPKVIVFFMAVLPSVVDLATLSLADVAILYCVIVAVLGAVMLGYSIAGAQARNLLRRPSALRVVNRVTGSVMAGAAIAIARN